MIALLLTYLCLANTAGPADSTVDMARAALAAGRPWRATRVIAPLLADSARRTPEVVLLAATAASRWEGWDEVQRLLEGQPWLDSLECAEGRRLLARAALERGADSLALTNAVRGLPSAPDSTAAELLVLFAQALERLDARDSAAAVYRQAADRLPAIADWLRLRAVAVTDDSVGRTTLAALVADSLVRTQLPWAVATARERTGDFAGAAADYTALGAQARALGFRLRATPDSAARAAIRVDLLELIHHRPNNGELRAAVTLLDQAFTPLTAAEQLDVARSAGQLLPARAVDGYRLAFAAGLGAPQDRFDYATALFRLGRYADAAFQFNLVGRPRRLAALAAYQRARALVRDGQLTEGVSALRDVARRYAGDTAAAPSALFLLADLAADRQDDAEARTLLRRLAVRYPASRFAPPAEFRAAIVAFVSGQFGKAAREWDDLARRYPTSDEALAATYWAGRAFAAAGDSTAAGVRWAAAIKKDSLSYYASLSARRLGQAPWVPAAATDTFAPVPMIDSAIARAALLTRLGLRQEAELEYRRAANPASEVGTVDYLLAAANALRSAGRAADAIRLARRALGRGAPAEARVYRLLYPVIYRDALVAEAAEQALDPNFVAALVRQESHFNPAATSAAGARGLTQIMPQVAAGLARSRGYPVWDPVLLYQPDVSLQLGVVHLRELTGRYDTAVRVLAAYNAGASRVDRWNEKSGVADPELFAERIPYAETRDYVRIIQRSQEFYRALYP